MIHPFDSLLAVLDPALCQVKPTAGWATLSWTVFRWLTTPSLILPILLALVILPWMLRSRRRKRLSFAASALLVLYLLAASPGAIAVGNRGLTTFLPNDSGTSAEAIVILGRGEELRPNRVEVAAQLWQEKRSPFIFASGWNDAIQMVETLRQKGIPDSALDGEPCSRTTEENAQFTAAMLQSRGIRRILLVTDPPHMLRSLLTFSSFGFEVTPHSNPLPPSISSQHRSFLVFREYIGLLAYGVRGRYLPRNPPATRDLLIGSQVAGSASL